jgi:hypothetical protein
MLYSAVTQPSAVSSSDRGIRHGGTLFSRLAVHSTIVFPALIKTLPADVFVNPRCTEIERS